MFSILKNKNGDVFKKHLLLVLYYFYLFFKIVIKNNYINMQND